MSEIWNKVKSRVEKYYKEYFFSLFEVEDERGIKGKPMLKEGKFVGVECTLPKKLTCADAKEIYDVFEKSNEVADIKYETRTWKVGGMKFCTCAVYLSSKEGSDFYSLEIEITTERPATVRVYDEDGAKLLDKILSKCFYLLIEEF